MAIIWLCKTVCKAELSNHWIGRTCSLERQYVRSKQLVHRKPWRLGPNLFRKTFANEIQDSLGIRDVSLLASLFKTCRDDSRSLTFQVLFDTLAVVPRSAGQQARLMLQLLQWQRMGPQETCTIVDCSMRLKAYPLRFIVIEFYHVVSMFRDFDDAFGTQMHC